MVQIEIAQNSDEFDKEITLPVPEIDVKLPENGLETIAKEENEEIKPKVGT